jgi:hypothetical protein
MRSLEINKVYLRIQPLFATLLAMRVKVYRGNQRHAELKAKERRDAEAAAAANASMSGPALSDSDLTDFDSHDEMPSLVHTIRFSRDDSKAKLQTILKGEEFNLRKRKVTNSPSKSIKRPKQSSVPVEPVEQFYNQNISSWTTANPEIIHVDNGHELLVAAAATGPSHGFVAVNQTKQPEQPVQPVRPVQVVPEISDSDENVSLLGETAMNQPSSEASSPNNETHPLPDTPGEGVLLPTQYSLPQDAVQPNGMTPKAAQRLHEYQRALAEVSADVTAEVSVEASVEASSQPQPSDKFIPWPKISKRRAKRSKTALRPMLDNDDMDLSTQDDKDPSTQDGQSTTELPSRPSISDLPPQQEKSIASVDDNGNTDSRKLMRRTHVHTPAADPAKRATSTVPTSTSTVPTSTPISTQKRTYQTPYADAHPPLPTPQSVSNSADAVLGAANSHPAPINSPLTASGPTIINQHMTSAADMPLSAKLITTHFANTFIKFTLPVPNRPSENKRIKLADCYDAPALHQAVINRFKHTLAGQVPSEVVFTFANENFPVEVDECGQSTWDDCMQTVVDNAAPGTCPIVASVRV